MDTFVIQGGQPLEGTVRINGSKNASLPQIAAALLTDEPVTLRDVPDLSDIRNMARLMEALGCPVVRHGHELTITTTQADNTLAHYDIVRTMRASICVLGPLLAKRGEAKVSLPGGCNIGDRPVDLHIRGLRALGANIHLDGGYIVASGHLRGASVFMGGAFGSTVLGTANVMCAATLADGQTILEAAACEPEIADLADMLIAMGANITGAGTPRIIIEGVKELHGTKHRVIADRIEAGTYILAAAITRGKVTLENCPTDALWAMMDRLNEVGITLETLEDHDHLRQTVKIVTAGALKPTQITTQPHPGFPTDLQAQMMALLCLADGNSTVTEKIFPDRFLHVAELLRMGAQLVRNGPTVVISGSKELIGAPVMASDLRASAGLVLAGLAARGTTTINRVYHLDRGYEKMDSVLQNLGADIQRTQESS